MHTRSAILFALASPLTLADSAQSQANGFIQDSAWSVLNRTVYDHREYLNGARNGAARNAYKPRDERNGYAEEWAYGLMAYGAIGLHPGLDRGGLDAHAYLGAQLDSGGGRAGKARLLGLDNQGHPKDAFSRGGAALQTAPVIDRAELWRAARENAGVQFIR